MRILTAAVAALAALAGCTGPSDVTTSATLTTLTDTCDEPECGNGTTRLSSVLVATDLGFAGRLATNARACVVGTACTPPTATSTNNLYANVTDGRLRSAALTLEWTAAAETTRTLTFGVMVMDHCGGCNVTVLQDKTGTSPLVLDAAGLDLPVGEHNWFHVYVAPTTVVAADPAFVAFATDQAFTVTGNATVEAVRAV